VCCCGHHATSESGSRSICRCPPVWFPAAEEIDECCDVGEAFLFATGIMTGIVTWLRPSGLEDGVKDFSALFGGSWLEGAQSI
jgi:hypothetical protein